MSSFIIDNKNSPNFLFYQSQNNKANILSAISESTNDDEISKEILFEERDDFFLTAKTTKLQEKQKKNTSSGKYKTEICKSWAEYGICSYGKKCLFAHGKEDLVEKDVFKGYKSKLCKSFHRKFFCPYGSRCTFIHECRDLKQIIEKNFYLKKINSCFFNNFAQKRLPIFNQISKMSEIQ